MKPFAARLGNSFQIQRCLAFQFIGDQFGNKIVSVRVITAAALEFEISFVFTGGSDIRHHIVMTKCVYCFPVMGIAADAAGVDGKAVFRAGWVFLQKLIIVLVHQRVCEISAFQLISAECAVMPCISPVCFSRQDNLIFERVRE